MEQKYRILHENFIDVDGKCLYQIQALKNLGEMVSAGELGGYIESEHNLSHDGLAWIQEGSKVYDRAKVCEDAFIGGRSTVCDNAQVRGRAIVNQLSHISGSAVIFGSALLDGSKVSGQAKVNSSVILETIAEDRILPEGQEGCINHKSARSRKFFHP